MIRKKKPHKLKNYLKKNSLYKKKIRFLFILYLALKIVFSKTYLKKKLFK